MASEGHRTDVLSALFGRSGTPGEGPALTFLKRIPLGKITIWLSFLALLYLLHDFFGVLFGTFILSYIGNSFVNRFEGSVKDRRILVLAYFAVILLIISGLGLLVIPRAYDEGKNFIIKAQERNPYVFLYEGLNEKLGPGVMPRLEKVLLADDGELKRMADASSIEIRRGGEVWVVSFPEEGDGGPVEAHRKSEGGRPKTGDTSPGKTDPSKPKPGKTDEASEAETAAAIEDRKKKAQRMGEALQHKLRPYATAAIGVVSKILGAFTKAVLQTIISLIFSFMIVWDLPRIKVGIRALEHSRLGAAYLEVAPSVANFGQLLGKAFQAQTAIAIVNTGLTATGLLILSIPGIGFLSIVVFVCSFIPVAGVFISTFPMAIVALAKYGIGATVGVVIMVIIVHAIEAYVLNPQIYSAHLKLHPLLVLVVLVIAEHTLGIWGLIVAVPFTVYVMRHVIMDAEREERISTTVDLVA